MIRRATAAELQELLQQQAGGLTALEEKQAAQWARLSRRVENGILKALEAKGVKITPEEQARILGELRGILQTGANGAGLLADQEALRVLTQAYDDQAKYFGRAYGEPNVLKSHSARIAQTFQFYDDRIQSGKFLRGAYWQARRADWTEDFVNRHRELTREVRKQMVQGLATGKEISTRDLAARIRGQLGETNTLTGRMPVEQWAQAYARTEYGQLYNEFAEQVATQAGVEKYVNIGVADDRQSLECYEASQQPPMTMEEWDSWTASNGRGGRPGERHVFNCRCIAGAVPPGLEDDDWTQPNEKFSTEKEPVGA